jgi:hypothetical protein
LYGSEEVAGGGGVGVCEAEAGLESLGAGRGSAGTVPRGVLVEEACDPVENALVEASFPLTLKGLGVCEEVPGMLWEGSGVGTRTGNPPLCCLYLRRRRAEYLAINVAPPNTTIAGSKRMMNCMRPDIIPEEPELERADVEEEDGLLELLAFALTVEDASCKSPGISTASIP